MEKIKKINSELEKLGEVNELMDKNDLDIYVDNVVEGLLQKWNSPSIQKYLGLTKDKIEDMITDYNGNDEDVYSYYENGEPVESAIEGLYEYFNPQLQSQMSAM